MDEIAPLGADLLDRATLTLQRAFDADPMFTWLFPDARRRARALHGLNRVPLEYGYRYGRVLHTDDGRAVAVWIPPGHVVTPGGLVRSGLLRAAWGMGPVPFVRFMRANASVGHIHETCLPGPHWYLMIIGVDPELQGRGRGTALIRQGLAWADAEELPCYLETSSPDNLRLYERHGFEVVASVSLSGGPTGWAMRRAPGGSA